MGWKCLFGHDYEFVDAYPEAFMTNILYCCCRCDKFRVSVITGTWQKVKDDDDGPDDPPTPPVMSPDDFYASLGDDK